MRDRAEIGCRRPGGKCRLVGDEEKPRQEDMEQPQQEGVKDDRELGGHDDEQHDPMPSAVEAVAELPDLLAAEVRPPTTHLELVVAIVASRQDGS
jgi:hypothetical protein